MHDVQWSPAGDFFITVAGGRAVGNTGYLRASYLLHQSSRPRPVNNQLDAFTLNVWPRHPQVLTSRDLAGSNAIPMYAVLDSTAPPSLRLHACQGDAASRLLRARVRPLRLFTIPSNA